MIPGNPTAQIKNLKQSTCLALIAASLAALLALAFPDPARGQTESHLHGQPQSRLGESRGGPVYVVLWFDTEDFILPQSDDSAKRIAEFLTQQGVEATFKVVGEKARELQRRGRKDVIAALDKHEIGYHSNYHSWHITVAEYEAPLDWQSGVEEFVRREQPGFEDVRRIFGKTPTCFGQPGNSWAPENQPAIREMGIKVYLDDGEHVGLNGQPFWYGGVLNIFNINYISDLRPNDDWSNLSQVEAAFKTAYSKLSANGGGTISIYFHPCEFVHREFWDAVNFAHGADPPRSQWKLPPMKTPAEQARAFEFFEGFVKYMKSYPVQFVTASGALKLYEDNAQGRSFSHEELSDIAQQVNPGVSFQIHGNYALSASEVLWLLNTYVARDIRKEPADTVKLEGTPLGPASAPVGVALNGSATEVPWYQFRDAVLNTQDFLQKNKQVPTIVWIGTTPYSPQSYLAALAHVASALMGKQGTPQAVSVPPAHLEAAKYVAKNSPKLWNWPIFRPGFDGSHLMELAGLQAWTLKPAQLETATRQLASAPSTSKLTKRVLSAEPSRSSALR